MISFVSKVLNDEKNATIVKISMSLLNERVCYLFSYDFLFEKLNRSYRYKDFELLKIKLDD